MAKRGTILTGRGGGGYTPLYGSGPASAFMLPPSEAPAPLIRVGPLLPNPVAALANAHAHRLSAHCTVARPELAEHCILDTIVAACKGAYWWQEPINYALSTLTYRPTSGTIVLVASV